MDVPARLRRAAPPLALVVATAILARKAIRLVLAKCHHPAAALDDAYIHYQYARAFAEGHPFRFQRGEAISTGATSFLWPLVLAPFHAIGFRGEAILWPAWALSFAALGALAWETFWLARPLAGRAAALGAASMSLLFGGLVWGAASGMEVVPFAWLFARTLRRSGDFTTTERSLPALAELLALALLCPLMRPEGAIASLVAGLVVATHPRPGAGPRRLEGLAFVFAAILPNLCLLALTGAPTSSTAQVKLLAGNPYYDLGEATIANGRVLVSTILDGEVWSAEFLPKGGAFLAIAGLMSIGWRGHKADRAVHAGLALVFALTMFVPCLYVTFLWNRLRYLWPFAPGWFIGVACLARTVGDIVAKVTPRAAPAMVMLLAGAVAGALASRLDWVLEDIAQSASGIDRQQADLGRWAKRALPASARIGVNDTGAIAYFGERRTFDIVGLTTPSEGRYWVAGVASRYEHYERMPRGALPTHFIVYPDWMAMEPVIGRYLHDATVTDSTILGGQTMRASEARWSHLGTGERPWSPLAELADSLDVADLESEAAHRYELLGAREGEQAVTEANDPAGNVVVDGARTNRLRDRFEVRLAGGRKLVAIVRAAGSPGASLTLRLNGRELGVAPLDLPWVEATFDVPTELTGPVVVEAASDAPFASYHYWFGAP